MVLRVLILILADLLLLSSHVFAQPAVPFPPSEEPPVLAPKLQKELGKALEALRADKPAEARSHLDAVYRLAPGDADANFLFGIYSAEMNDWVHAKSYWEKVLVLAPNHLSALLSLGGALMPCSRMLACVRACLMSPSNTPSAPSSWVMARRESSSQSWRGLSTCTATRSGLSMFSKRICRITLQTLPSQNNLRICRPLSDQPINPRPAQLRHRRRQSLLWQP